MDEYLANKMCELIASTTPYSKKEVKGVYERTKSVDETVLILNMASATCTSPYGILEIEDKKQREIKKCSDCGCFKQLSNSNEGICSKGHGIVRQQPGGLPLGYRNYYDEACSEALMKEGK